MRKRRRDQAGTEDVRRRSLGELLEIPNDLLSDVPRITMTDNREIYVENYKSVLDYDENAVRLSAGDYVIHITGRDLDIYTITDEEIGIRGRLDSVAFAP